MIVRFFKKNKKRIISDVNPDEIFLDSTNLENFDTQQFEGRIEKPISDKTTLILGSFFVCVIIIFGFRLLYLQIQNGEEYKLRAENNTLEKVTIFTERGIIYDRNKVELAWNKKTNIGVESTQEISGPVIRTYMSPGFSHVLGYVSYPKKDAGENYWQYEFKGIDGLEKTYNDAIKGENGSKIIEVDARGTIHSENIINAPARGEGLVTSLDSRIQQQLFTIIKDTSTKNSFAGGAGVVMDATNGEVIASTSFPEYDSEILSLGKDKEIIKSYITDKRKFFMDRTISGLYTPGSIVKPFFALGALIEGVIDPLKEILSTGSISIQNPYDKTKKTVFNDWKAHGWTNMAESIAVSSDVYFYTIGGGFENQKGIGILNLEKYARMFGIGKMTGVDLPDEKSGTIPNPEWKAKNFNGEIWRVGDTYNTSIGQYGFQVTPMEMTRAVGAIANLGTLMTPHFILNDKNAENKVEKMEIKKEYYDVVYEGMRGTVTYGTATLLNVPYVEVAAKTGTAQIGVAKDRVNSWVIGFFPYENPKYAFTIMMESGPSNGTVNAASVMRQLLDWMYWNTPEYFLAS